MLNIGSGNLPLPTKRKEKMNNNFIKELKKASGVDNFHFATNKIGNLPTSVLVNDFGVLANFEANVPLTKSSLYIAIFASFSKKELVISKGKTGRISIFIKAEFI